MVHRQYGYRGKGVAALMLPLRKMPEGVPHGGLAAEGGPKAKEWREGGGYSNSRVGRPQVCRAVCYSRGRKPLVTM
jgi:hypothetical protein